MTTLKSYFADEIAMALDAQLKDENFMGLYKKAEVAWWDKGPTAKAYKTEVDTVTTKSEVVGVMNKYLGGGDLTTALGREGVEDHTPLREYGDDKMAKLQSADDKPCGTDDAPCAHDGDQTCPKCADKSLAIAVDFAIRHMVKIADALDKAGFPMVAEALDETLNKLAVQRPIVVLAGKKAPKAPKRSYKEWVSFFAKKDPKISEKFRKAYKEELEQAKKKDMDAEKIEAYCVRRALGKMSKSHLKEPVEKKVKPPVAKKQ